MGAPEKSSWRRWSTAANGSCRSRHSMSAPRFRCPQANFCAWRATSAANFSCDSPMRNPQLNGDGKLQHLLTIERLPREILAHILDTAASFIGVTERAVTKVPLLLDMSTIRDYQEAFAALWGAIVRDVLHSRVARSLIHALTALATPDVRVIGPRTLLPTGVEQLGVCVHHDMREGLAGCDVVVMLRLQNERMKGPLLPSAQEFFKSYGLTPQKLALAKPDAIVMHPGPMNRGIEIDSSVADGPHSVILPQVTFGIAVRMAVMSIVAG